MHFAAGGAGDGERIRLIARRPGIQMEGHVAMEVVEGGDETAHGSEGAVVEDGLGEPLTVLPAITQGEGVGGDAGIFPDGLVHAERAQDLAGDVFLIGTSADAGDDVAEEGVAEIAVFPGDTGRIGMGEPFVEEGFEVADGIGQAPVAPRIVLWESAGHAEEMGDGDDGRIQGVWAGLAEPGQVTGHGIGQGKTALIAELEDGQGGEALGHGSDAEPGVRADGDLFVDLGGAVGEGVDEFAVDDDAVDEAGDVIGGGLAAVKGVEFGGEGEDAGETVGIGEAGWIDLGEEWGEEKE